MCTECGFKYNKTRDGLCRLCFMINDVKMQYINELILCYSKLTQKDIVLKTINFISIKGKIPMPTDIDADVILAEYPLYKYDRNANHKIFVTNLFDFSYFPTKKLYFGDGFCSVNDYFSHEKYLFDDKILTLPVYNPLNEIVPNDENDINHNDNNIKDKNNDLIIDKDNEYDKYTKVSRLIKINIGDTNNVNAINNVIERNIHKVIEGNQTNIKQNDDTNRMTIDDDLNNNNYHNTITNNIMNTITRNNINFKILTNSHNDITLLLNG